MLLLVLISPWGLGLEWRSLSYVSLVMTAIWIAVALVAWREYLRAFRASIGARTIAPGTIRTEVDPATIETLVEELSHPDEAAVLYAIEMLEALDKRHLVTPLLLQHQSPRVRARTLRALAYRARARRPDGCRPSPAWCRTRTWTCARRRCVPSPSSSTRMPRSSCAAT